MFDDIRPYRNQEVAEVVARLVTEKELQASIASIALPRLYRLSPGLSRWLVKAFLSWRTRKMHSVASVQQLVATYLENLMDRTCDGFTFAGIDKLDKQRPTLFISNHRDIALDPALVNLALFEAHRDTVEIAIGDNLLTKDWISDLMRLNKSFIVKRNEQGKRAMLAASKHLSAYIHHTLTEQQHCVWIAQREGRAKDGLDKTNPALISMLLLNKPKDMSIAEYLEKLHIVPVSISYEFDPCDRDKARELAAIETDGRYEKSEHEDIQSIIRGIMGDKGRIHIEFGQALTGEFADSKAIAAEIDRQIVANYRLFDSNLAAHEMIQTQQLKCRNAFESRLAGLSDVQQRWLLAMYANPVLAKQSESELTE